MMTARGDDKLMDGDVNYDGELWMHECSFCYDWTSLV